MSLRVFPRNPSWVNSLVRRPYDRSGQKGDTLDSQPDMHALQVSEKGGPQGGAHTRRARGSACSVQLRQSCRLKGAAAVDQRSAHGRTDGLRIQ